MGINVESQAVITYTVYSVTNLINGKMYIGRTVRSLSRRWSMHIQQSSGCTALAHAIRKYGAGAFRIEAIAQTQWEQDVYGLERTLIAQWGSQVPHGYNMAAGGRGGGAFGHSVSLETRIRIREAQLGKKQRPPTLEERQKISAAMKGKKKSPEHIAKVRAAHIGLKRSAQARANISAAHKGFIHSEEERQKRRGWKHTPEARAKISAASKLSWENGNLHGHRHTGEPNHA